jgi:tRNA pseudouridine55 synthase
MNGWLLIDKPSGITSRDAVNRVQRWFPKSTRIGHTGTLDPRATGLLVLCIGSATRLAEYVQEQGKCYLSQFLLGATSDSDDADGEILETANATAVTEEAVRAALQSFLGEIMQVPPGYSAVKVDGRRAHKIARAGKTPDLKPRPVTIELIDVRGYNWPFLDLEISCGKGTYIRSLARDLGQQLGCGGLVQSLRRTQVGAFHVADAISLDASREHARDRLLPMDQALLSLTRVELPAGNALKFVQGQRIAVTHTDCEVGRVYGPMFLGLGRVRQGLVKPLVVVADRHEV